jgi:hypothetical protein
MIDLTMRVEVGNNEHTIPSFILDNQTEWPYHDRHFSNIHMPVEGALGTATAPFVPFGGTIGQYTGLYPLYDPHEDYQEVAWTDPFRLPHAIQAVGRAAGILLMPYQYHRGGGGAFLFYNFGPTFGLYAAPSPWGVFEREQRIRVEGKLTIPTVRAASYADNIFVIAYLSFECDENWYPLNCTLPDGRKRTFHYGAKLYQNKVNGWDWSQDFGDRIVYVDDGQRILTSYVGIPPVNWGGGAPAFWNSCGSGTSYVGNGFPPLVAPFPQETPFCFEMTFDQLEAALNWSNTGSAPDWGNAPWAYRLAAVSVNLEAYSGDGQPNPLLYVGATIRDWKVTRVPGG